jgi:hypothetical protein
MIMVEMDSAAASAIAELARDISELAYRGDAKEYARSFSSAHSHHRLYRTEKDHIFWEGLRRERRRAERTGPRLCEAIEGLRVRARELDPGLAVDLAVARTRVQDMDRALARLRFPRRIGAGYKRLNARADEHKMELVEISNRAQAMVGDPPWPLWLAPHLRVPHAIPDLDSLPAPKVDARAERIMAAAVGRLPEPDRTRYRDQHIDNLRFEARRGKVFPQLKRALRIRVGARDLGARLRQAHSDLTSETGG